MIPKSGFKVTLLFTGDYLKTVHIVQLQIMHLLNLHVTLMRVPSAIAEPLDVNNKRLEFILSCNISLWSPQQQKTKFFSKF